MTKAYKTKPNVAAQKRWQDHRLHANHQIRFDYELNPASQIVRNDTSNSRYHYVSHNKGSESYAVNGLNQYTSINGQSVTHDSKGNLTAHAGVGYQYDTENRLVRVSYWS